MKIELSQTTEEASCYFRPSLRKKAKISTGIIILGWNSSKPVFLLIQPSVCLDIPVPPSNAAFNQIIEEWQLNDGKHLCELPGMLPSCTKPGQGSLGHGLASLRGMLIGAAWAGYNEFLFELVPTNWGDCEWQDPRKHWQASLSSCQFPAKNIELVLASFVPAVVSHNVCPSGYQVQHPFSSSRKQLQWQPPWIMWST